MLDGGLVCQAELVGIAVVDVFLAMADFGFVDGVGGGFDGYD